jgi:hypothetical protein
MSNRRQKIDPAVSKQPGLFDTSLPEGSLDVLLGLKQLMSREMNGHDRYLISAQISRLTGRDLSKDMLDKYVSSDASYRPPSDMLVAFCHVVGSLEVFHYLLEHLDADVIGPEDVKFLKLARLEEQRRRLDGEIQQLRTQCGIR